MFHRNHHLSPHTNPPVAQLTKK
uniref:Uncharacterized protein n=1 Tax=Arundo donax TaxID=35708 RepID=A0A0A8ZWW3_ARUDO